MFSFVLCYSVIVLFFHLHQQNAGCISAHLIRVRKLELPAVSSPADEGLAGFVCQELQQKLPELYGSAAWTETQHHHLIQFTTNLNTTYMNHISK